jgi:hypothetical protein
MKKILLAFLLISASSAKAQINVGDVINQVNTTVKNYTGKGLSNEDIIKGLKNALSKGSQSAGDQASQPDGFYKNEAIKLPFPQDALKMRTALMQLGMTKEVNDFEEQLNRAAEDAAKKAAPIFLSAITKMTITDGLTILQGGNDAATQYLRKTTVDDLRNAFLPVAQSSLEKVEIAKYWNPLFTAYDKIPFSNKVNPDLNAYVTDKAIEGLFKLVADEELKIRKDPKARTTAILKKVFGSQKK